MSQFLALKDSKTNQWYRFKGEVVTFATQGKAKRFLAARSFGFENMEIKELPAHLRKEAK